MDDEAVLVSYIVETLGDCVFPLELLMTRIRKKAPFPIKRYFLKQCRNLTQLEDFLLRHEDRFFVENRKVTVFDPILETASEDAVTYFEDTFMDFYTEPINYMNFRGHVGQASEHVKSFMKHFYPREEFKNFLLAHPDVFYMLDNDTVCLIESEAVDYFQKCIADNREGWHFNNLRGCVGQAPRHVMTYINDYYPEDDFQEFLGINQEVFDLDDEYVFLQEVD